MHACFTTSKQSRSLHTPVQYFGVPALHNEHSDAQWMLTDAHAGPTDDDVIRRNLLQAASTTSSAATTGKMITIDPWCVVHGVCLQNR